MLIIVLRYTFFPFLIAGCTSDYCLNEGTCRTNSMDHPTCSCSGPFKGDRCEISKYLADRFFDSSIVGQTLDICVF